MLIDPPFEERADYTRVHDAAADALQRFPGAVLVLWVPVKLRADFDSWLAALCRAVDRPTLASLLWVHPTDSRAALNGSALVVVNPPYLIEEGVREWLPELRDLLGGAAARLRSAASADKAGYQRTELAISAATLSGTAPARDNTATRALARRQQHAAVSVLGKFRARRPPSRAAAA